MTRQLTIIESIRSWVVGKRPCINKGQEALIKIFEKIMNKTKTNSNSRNKRYKKRTSNRRQTNHRAADMSQYTNNGIKGKASKEYRNTFSFRDFGLSPQLLELIGNKDYQNPSEIQDKSIFPILEGSDIIGIAGTGTGKTAAFLIPIVQKLIVSKRENYALIIAPTRELANQINDEFRSLTKGLGLFSTCLIGGSSVYESIKNLKRRNHIIIGTPGRLQDMAKQRVLNYEDFKVLILDEFDRMLDMGFSREIQSINNEMASKEQTLLYSATLDPTQQGLVDKITHQAFKIESEHSLPQIDSIDQKVIHTNGQDKFGLVRRILSEPDNPKTILFCETKRHTERMLKRLKAEQFKADAIHGDKSQRAREVALRKFRKGHVNILVATDVVARGIDVNDVELVINYQAPRNYTDYVHRIGRTGRAGRQGRAITLME